MIDKYNLKVFKVKFDEGSKIIKSNIFGFQRNCSIQMTNMPPLISSIQMKLLWFLKPHNKLDMRDKQPFLKALKKYSAVSKIDLLANAKLVSLKRIIFNDKLGKTDLVSKLFCRLESRLGAIRQSVDLAAGQDLEKPYMALRLFSFLRMKCKIEANIPNPFLKSEKRISFSLKKDLAVKTVVTSLKKIIFKDKVCISSKPLFIKSESKLGKVNQKLDYFCGRDSDTPFVNFRLLRILRLSEYDGKRLMNMDNIQLGDMNYGLTD